MFLILATAFLDILGIGILIPVLPDIISHFGVSEAWNPYSQGIYSIGMFAGGLVFGRLSDKYGRKNLLSVTTSFNLLGYIILYFSLSSGIISADMAILFIIFLAARFVSGLGGAGLGVAQAYISDISTPTTKTKNMGMIGAAFGLAFLIGPAIGGLLSHWGIEYVILGCIIAITTNLVLILMVIREPNKHEKEMHGHNVPFRFSQLMIILFILSFGGTLAFSSIQSGSSQFYRDIYGFSTNQIGYTLSLVGLIAIIYQGGIIGFVRRALTEIQMIQVAVGLMTVSLFLFAINRNVYLLFPIIALFPIAMGTFQPAINSLIAEKAGKEVGKVMGYNTSVISVASIIGPFIVGTLYVMNYSLPFYVSTGIAFILFIVAILGLKQQILK
ncbi:MFS transporter [Candidatus Gracilibacteria bacterium]|nr:MFS transporter [Candidatus Gracilibacteria bacterium]